MEQRLAALFATVGNALDSSTYTYSDSDYLVRKALTEFLDGENALVASARKIQDSSEVVTSVLNYIVSTDFSVEDPAEWYRKAMRIVVEFSDFAFRNEMSEDSARYSALLPEGHPRALNSITLTASAQQSALAEWMAADPRLDEEASAQIRKLYSSSELDDLDLEFEYLKAEAMVASGKMPEDLLPLTAAFNLSRAQRSAISKFFEKFRRRDRKGRFAEEFGRLSLIFGDKKGGFFSKAPKIVGPGNGPDRAIVEFDGSDPRIPKGLYDVDATKGENVKAYLPTSAVKGLPKGREVVAEGDKQYAIGLDELLANKVETPLNWEKSGKGFKAKDGKFVAEPISNSDAEKAIDRARERGDELIIAGAGDGDAFDPEAEGGSFLVADAKGKTLGVAQDWAGIEEIAIANGSSVDDFQPFKRPEDDFPELKTPEKDSRFEGFRPYDGRDVQATNRNSVKRAERKRLEDSLGRKLTADEISALDLELESESFVGKRSPYEGAEFYVPGQNAEADAKYKAFEKKRAETLRNLKAELDGKTSSPDLDQDIPGGIDKSKLSPSMLGEGYNFSKEGENSWVQEGVGSNGESYSVSKAPNGKWVVSERSGSEGDNAKERDLQSFDTAEEAFDFANDQGTSPNEFDEAWVNELMSEGGPDLDQNVAGPKNKVDVSGLSPEDLEGSQKYIDSINQAIFNNDLAGIYNNISKAAVDSNVSDKAYSAINAAKDAHYVRSQEVENALAGGSREDVEALLENPEYAGWAGRLEDALNVDLNQEAPTLSEKQSEPASGKQYAFLDEFLAERQLDPATEQAFKDAIANKNLNKAQASSLIAIGRSADFKPDVDPTKPSERMLNSLQGYLSSKDLAPSEIKEVLDSLQKDGSRDNVDALLNKLRRKKDKPVDLNQGASSLTRHSDGSYEWEDVYNNVNVNKTSKGWEVEYTSPSVEDGINDWYYKSFNSEDEALAFAEELIKQNQEDSGYGRAADDLKGLVDLNQDVDSWWDLDLDVVAKEDQEKYADQIAKINFAMTFGHAPTIKKFREEVLADKSISDQTRQEIVGVLEEWLERDGEVYDRLSDIWDADTVEQLEDAWSALAKLDNDPEFAPWGWFTGDLFPRNKVEYPEVVDRVGKFYEAETSPNLNQDVKSTRADAATDKQWDFLQSLLDGKKINNPELESAVRSALEDRKLTKGEVGAFIGQLRPLEDKPNVRREPSAKQIASIKRALLERDMTPEERKSMQDKLAAGLSFDEASEMLNDLKKRDITLDGMINLLSELKSEQDIDTLRYLLDKPEYSKYRTDIKDTLRQLALDTEDPYLQEFIDAREDVDLDQNVTGRRYGNDWDIEPELLSPEDRDRYSREISEVNLAVNIGHYPTVKSLAEKYSNDSSLPENVRAEILHSLETWLEYDADVTRALEAIWDDEDEADSYDAKRKIDLFIGNAVYRPWWPLLAYDNGGYNIVQSKEEYDEVMDDLGLDLKDAMDDVDLDQDVSGSSTRDRIAEKLAEDIDALDSLAINGKELKNYLEEFDRTRYTSTAAEMAAEVENMSNYVDDPELKQRLRDLSSRLNDEIVDRFGIADAARADGDEILDLDDIERAVQDDIEMFFETDAEKIERELNKNDSYGDSKSGGAEVFVSQEDDGTWTASVQYDRSDDQFNGEDRSEVIAQAAAAAADYNSDVIPGAYGEIDDLSGQAAQAQTPDAASELADRMDALAAAMSESRGDQGLASNLRQYGLRIREMIEKRDRQRQSEVESEPLNSETMDEMATDPDLNPAGYADYIGNQVFELVGGKQSGVTSANNFISSDGRVELVVEKDGKHTVIVDGEEVFSGERTSDRWEFVAGVEKAIEEHFSKKA